MDRWVDFYTCYCPLLSQVTDNNIKTMKVIIKFSGGISVSFLYFNIQMLSVGLKTG